MSDVTPEGRLALALGLGFTQYALPHDYPRRPLSADEKKRQLDLRFVLYGNERERSTVTYKHLNGQQKLTKGELWQLLYATRGVVWC